jgi:hypothetical protein
VKRFEDWPSRLDAAIEAARGQPFDWVAHNCATFCAACVHAITGVDHGPAFAALHTSALNAARASGRLMDEVSARLGGPIAASFAQRGDVVLVRNGGRDLLGICVGAQVAAVGETGLAFVSIKEGVCAWHI